MRRPLLSIKQILTWIDAFYASCGRWPHRDDGRIPGSLGETWCAVDQALTKRWRGLSYRSSLAQLLQEKRGVRHRLRLPRLDTKLILQWADEHHQRTRFWPTSVSGNVLSVKGETWSAIDRALRNGSRGLPDGSSLAKLLHAKRGVRTTYNMPPLTERMILRWAKAHHRKTDYWPARDIGSIHEAPEETWGRINTSLINGHRGLPGGSSLAQLLTKVVGYRNHKSLPPLTIQQILKWADEYVQRLGRWPTHLSGSIDGSSGETWGGLHAALSRGNRGLPGGSSLYQVLRKYRGVPRYRPKGKLALSA